MKELFQQLLPVLPVVIGGALLYLVVWLRGKIADYRVRQMIGPKKWDAAQRIKNQDKTPTDYSGGGFDRGGGKDS